MGETTPQEIDLSDYVPKTDVEGIVKERIGQIQKKTAEKYADYEDLKAKAAKLAEIEGSNKSEIEKIIARAETAEKERDELAGKIQTHQARKEALKKAKALFETAQIKSDGWELVEDLISATDDDEALAAKLEKVKKAVGVRDVGGAGRTPPPTKTTAPTNSELLAAEYAKEKPDTQKIISLKRKIAAGDV
jgi:Rad3-related DNA helicase